MFKDRRRELISVGIASVLAALAVTGAQGQPVYPAPGALAEFSKRIDGYVALHKRLANAVGALDETKSQEKIAERATALGNAIRTARAQAKPGDIFAPKVAAILKQTIRDKYRRSAAVRETRKDAEDELPDFTPQVNALYPTTYPLATFPPTLLRLLPPLPEQVEYRIVKNYLILRDTEANLIVDFIPNAVP